MLEGYSMCLNKWALDKEIKNELGLLLIISSLCAEKGFCWANNEYFSSLFNESEVNISRKIKRLENKNYITVDYKKSGTVVTQRIITVNINDNGPLTKMLTAVNKNVKENNINIKNIYTTTIINSDDIFEFIEKNFMRTLTPIEYEKIKEWEDNELTRYVISKAVLNQKYNINYIDKVLYEMKQKGIYTVQQAQQSDEEYRKSKQKPKATFVRYKTAYDREQEAIAKFLSDENE